VLYAIDLEIGALADAQSIAIGFTKKPDVEPSVFTFPAYSELVEKIEKLFEIDLSDELVFFAATGKAGEIF
jgi:leucyl aminopeptidase